MTKNAPLSDAVLARVERHLQRQAAAERAAKRKPDARRAPGKPEDANLPTPERRARDQFERVDAASIDKAVTGDPLRCVSQTPLDRYFRRGEITQHQWLAGERLRGLWRAAGLEPRMVANLLGAGGGGWADVGGARLDALQAFVDVMREVGRQLVPVLVHVVGLDKPASDWAAGRGYGRSAAAAVGLSTLRLALDGLCHHWGLTQVRPER